MMSLQPGSARPLPAMFWIIVTVVGIAYFRAENEWQFAKHDSVLVVDEQADTYTGSGDTGRRIGFSLLALLGAWLIWEGRDARLHFGLLAQLIILLLAWCAGSVIWSSEPGTSGRRLLVLAFCCVGAFGLARQLDNEQWCLMVVMVTSTYAVVGLLSEISMGAFQPFSAEHRFSGTTHPNNQALYLITLAISALVLAAQRGVRYAVVACAALVLLVLTKSRTAFAALMVAVSVAFVFRLSARARLVSALALVAVASLLVLSTQLTPLVQAPAGDGMSFLGRQVDVDTLTGRVPLWRELVPYLQARPVLGYGYQAFWTRQRYLAIAEELEWAVSHAHSAYIETVLNVGLVGLALLLAVVVVAMIRGIQGYRRTGSLPDLAIVALLIVGVTHAVLESTMIMTMYVPVLIASRVLRLGFFVPLQTSTDGETAVETSLVPLVRTRQPGSLEGRWA